MLTLASNERIPLTSSMRLLLEINHMNHCSPATVSRGGVIFVNADDIGWKPAVESWIERLECADYRPLLSMLFRRGAPPSGAGFVGSARLLPDLLCTGEPCQPAL